MLIYNITGRFEPISGSSYAFGSSEKIMHFYFIDGGQQISKTFNLASAAIPNTSTYYFFSVMVNTTLIYDVVV